ncbi:hypothetical protein TNCV_1035501 [Trichonephila clavipes]|nr:hypothetical protein TNCV_1035501 [Trichonephila clavipes]
MQKQLCCNNCRYALHTEDSSELSEFSKFNPPTGQHEFFCPTREASKTDHTEFFLDGHGYELVSSVRVLVPQKFSVEEELMHVKHIEVKSPHVGVMWNSGRGVISKGIVLVT